MNRAISFLREFLHEFSRKQDPDLTECVCISYQNSLKQYHNWVVRSIFSIALRSLPTKENFLQGLANDPDEFVRNKEEFEIQIKNEMRLIFQGIDVVLNIIDEFYAKNNLEK
jgi:hypothetical protein